MAFDNTKRVNIGTSANDRTGDNLRSAFTKINNNFSELYTALGLDSDTSLNLGAFEFTGSVMTTTDSSAITIDQAVTVSSDLTVGGDVVPSTDFGSSLGSATKRFKDLYISNNTIFLGNTSLGVSSDGDLTVGGASVSSVIDYNDIQNKPTLFDGAYGSLTGTPTIPADVGDLTDTGGLLGAGGIALTDLSVGAEAAASGDGGIAYDNSTGVFTYTPPDLSGYQITLVSGTSIKTLNNSSLLGSGNIDIEAYSDDKVNLLLGTDGGVTTGYILSYDNSEPIQKYQWIPQADLSITESQISDLGAYITASSLTGLATETYVNTAVSNLVDTAPEALNTLNELAAALGDDENYATTTSTALGNRLRVDTNAQGLSTEQKNNAKTNLGLSTVASTGAYSDLSGTPTIPADVGDLTDTGNLLDGVDLTAFSVGAEAAASGDGGIAYNNSTGVFTYTPPDLSGYQATLVSGTNIKTINGASVLGSGDIVVAGSYGNNDVDTHLNTGTASSGEVLSWNGSDYDWVAQSGGLSNIVEDTTPQLGGTLDANGNTIDMGTNTITDTKVGNWDTAHGWGDHSAQGYLTAEADTLATVTGRGATTTTTAVIPFYYANQSAFPSATTYHGAIAHSHSDGAMYFAHGGSWNKLANDSQLANSTNWNTAYGWGDHSTAGYLTSTNINTSTSGSDALITLTNSAGGSDSVTLAAGSNITISESGDTIIIASTASGSALTIQDEGSDLTTDATTLNFVGAGVTASGTGSTKTITIPGGASTGDITFTGSTIQSPSNADITLSPGGTGKVVVNGLNFSITGVEDDTATFSTTSSGQTLDSFSATDYRSAKYIIQAFSGTDVHATELLLTHDDTTVYTSESNTTYSSSSLITLGASISSGNVVVTVTPANAGTTVDFYRTTLIARTLTLAGDLQSLTGTVDLQTDTGSEDLLAA